VRVQSGAIGFLERVTSWGHLAAIATGNFADAADLKLRLSGLSGHFRDVITADDAPNREAIVQRALDALTRRALVDDVQPERAYLFGDTMQDVEAARASRIAAIIVNTDCTVGDGVLLTITDFTDDRLTQLFQCDGKGMP
jgi:phosphoglycolate phosphatase-like HAD superfamily hydrolase